MQDQIRLWERETQRVELAPAHLYQHFEDATLYERSRAFAQQRGFLLWEAAEKDKQAFAVAAAGACAALRLCAVSVRFASLILMHSIAAQICGPTAECPEVAATYSRPLQATRRSSSTSRS